METFKLVLGILMMAACGAVIALIGAVLFNTSFLVALLIVWLLEYALFNEYAIRKIEHDRDERYEVVRAFLQGFEKKEIVRALEVATITFQTLVVHHKEFEIQFGDNRTTAEQQIIDKTNEEMHLARKKYVLTRSMIITFRTDLPLREGEAFNTFLPKGWKPKRYA